MIPHRHLPILVGVALLAALPLVRAMSSDDMVLSVDFEGQAALKPWIVPGGEAIGLAAGFRGSQSLCVERQPGAEQNLVALRLPLPAAKLAGKFIGCQAMLKADRVTEPPKHWNGIKLMLHYVAASGKGWLQRNGLYGTFEWKPVFFTARIPRDVSEAWLFVGLESVSGKVWFDDIMVTVGRPPVARRPRPENVYTGRTLPRLRGAMVRTWGGDIDEGMRVLGDEWNANVVRWQLRSPGGKGPPPEDLAAYDRWLDRELSTLDKALPICEKHGLKVVVDLHCKPGGTLTKPTRDRMFRERKYQEKLVAAWKRIASRYRGHKAVWAYDLINEPVQGIVAEGLLDWQALAARTAKAVRAVDPDTAIIVEPSPWAHPFALDNFLPIDVPGVVYSIHMYLPHNFTHQGIKGLPWGLKYPGEIDGVHWDAERVRTALQPAADFQRDYGVHIFVGEFSAIRSAADHSAFRYIRDVIDVFEQHGWDWAYHAFREWDGWSAEHGPDLKDRSPSKTQTDRERLLRSLFAKNLKPQK